MDSAEINVSFYNIIYEKKKDYLVNFNHKVAKWSKAVMLITLSFIEINRDMSDHFEGYEKI
jgi:SepF-like predicted cell division protein (DUF552 family)